MASRVAGRARARRHATFFAQTGLCPGMRVVDIGCGALGLRALEPELDVTGVDLLPRPS
jgi:cyclopropane fatty-acyl-phospholipid synthase-like methyltransferase